MRRYRFTMFEKRTIEMIYTVEADTLEDALKKAEAGDTVDEDFVRDLEVTGREMYEELADED